MPAFARGSLDVVGILYLIGGALAIYLIYLFWVFLIGFVVMPFTVAISFDKKLDEGLSTFAVSGFFITCMLPITIIDKNFFKLEWYGYVVVLVVWFAMWYLLAKYIQYRVEKQATNSKE